MKVQVLLSLNAIPLSDEQKQIVHSGGGEWEILDEVEEFYLVHAIVELESIAAIKSYLNSLLLNPIIIGVFDINGIADENYPVNNLELSNFTAGIAQTHQFGGWEIPTL